MADKQKTKKGGIKRKAGIPIPAPQMKIATEIFYLTKITLTDQNGKATASFTPGGNVTMQRAQALVNELVVEMARAEGKATATKGKTIVTGGDNDGKPGDKESGSSNKES